MFFIAVIVLVALDQISKYFVVEHLKGESPLVILDNFLNFYYIENRGAAFGILQEKRILFILITIIVVAILVFSLFKYKDSMSGALKLALILILSGTIGNFIDRVRLHYVIDFISVKIFGYDFAVFNLADVFIVLGSLLLIIIVLLSDNKSSKQTI